MTWENKYEDIYEAMNILENAVSRRDADTRVVDGIEAWLRGPDEGRPDFAEALAQGIQDAVTNAISVNGGNITITIMRPGDSMIRFEFSEYEDAEPSEPFQQAVMNAVKQVLKER